MSRLSSQHCHTFAGVKGFKRKEFITSWHYLPTVSLVDFKCIYFVSLTLFCLNMQPLEFTCGLYLFYREIFLLKYTAIILYLSCALGDKETKSDLVILQFLYVCHLISLENAT